MDTNQLEKQAENYISSQLSKFDFLVSKPLYDKNGCDLQILDHASNPTRLLRIQSKGRSISNDTNVEIPKKYVNDNFVLFVYLIDENRNEHLYAFFDEQIKLFPSDAKHYNIFFPKKTFGKRFADNLFSMDYAGKIRELLNKTKIKKETTLIIDCFSLENSLKSTTKIYKEIYPEKELFTPNILECIKYIISCYEKNEFTSRVINVCLFISPHNFTKTSFYDPSELLFDDREIRIFEMKINSLISFEVRSFVKRIINSENIILVASDIQYLPILEELQDENMDIILVCEKLDNGLRSLNYRWGDISFPLGLAIGLIKNEL